LFDPSAPGVLSPIVQTGFQSADAGKAGGYVFICRRSRWARCSS